MGDKYTSYKHIKRQDAFVASRKIGQKAYAAKDTAGAVTAMLITDELRAIPPVDAVEVVRCKDCDLWNEWDHSGRESLGNFRCSCAHWSVEDGPVFFTAPTDFCSYAEPKEEP